MFLPAGKVDKRCINESCLDASAATHLGTSTKCRAAVSRVGYWVPAVRLGCMAVPVLCSPGHQQLLMALGEPTHPQSKDGHIRSLVWGDSWSSSDKILTKYLNSYDSSQISTMWEEELGKDRDKTHTESINYADAFLICK